MSLSLCVSVSLPVDPTFPMMHLVFTHCKAEDSLTLDVEDGGGRAGVALLDPPQPPQHLHGLGGADGSTGEVEGNIWERGDVLRLLDEVRDTCRRQETEKSERRA